MEPNRKYKLGGWLFLFVTIVVFAELRFAQQTPQTCWGWIKGHVEVEGGTVRQLRGQVVDPAGKAVPGALIEVFAYNSTDIENRTRVGYSVVGSNGTFHFRGLLPGKYELRASYCNGFDAGHTIVKLRPKSRHSSNRPTSVTLNISQ